MLFFLPHKIRKHLRNKILTAPFILIPEKLSGNFKIYRFAGQQRIQNLSTMVYFVSIF
jgi:hypothetical protein